MHIRKRTIAAIVILTLLLCAVATFYYMKHSGARSTYRQVEVDTTLLRTGDLMFRNGRSNESAFVTGVSSGAYSHIGIAYHDGYRWCVIHAVPNEIEKLGDPEYLKCEPIAEYYNIERACDGAVARVECSKEKAERAAQYALQKVKAHVVFDNSYDTNDTTELYCTELVNDAYLSQGIDLAEGRITRIPYPGTSGAFIFPEDIWQSKLVKQIYKATTINH